ncbi:MAG: ABC transporter permease [Anaerocolumna sp.]
MISLLKLEFKKFKLLKYGLNFIIITLAILGMTTLMGAADADGDVMFVTAGDLFEFGDIIIRVTFTIFSGVLLSRLIISEFKNSTIKIMFTYPISRKKIIGVKLIIIWGFIFAAIILESILFGLGVQLIDRVIEITPDTIIPSELAGRASAILYSAVVTSGLGLIPLFFGMRKKSASTTIIVAMIVSLLINSTSGNQGESLFSSTVIPLLLCIIGVMVAFVSYYDIDKKDIN